MQSYKTTIVLGDVIAKAGEESEENITFRERNDRRETGCID